MRHRVVWPFAAVLLMAGCAVSSVPGRSGFGGTTPVVVNDNPNTSYRQEMTLIAAQYEADLSWNDPRHVSEDVANCYKNKGSRAILGNFRTQSIRWCLALDYVAYKDNQAATHDYRTPGNPYFSREAAKRRWAMWGPEAGFTDAESMFQYMRGTYSFVKPTQVNITNAMRPRRLLPAPGQHLPSFMAAP